MTLLQTDFTAFTQTFAFTNPFREDYYLFHAEVSPTLLGAGNYWISFFSTTPGQHWSWNGRFDPPGNSIIRQSASTNTWDPNNDPADLSFSIMGETAHRIPDTSNSIALLAMGLIGLIAIRKKMA